MKNHKITFQNKIKNTVQLFFFKKKVGKNGSNRTDKSSKAIFTVIFYCAAYIKKKKNQRNTKFYQLKLLYYDIILIYKE